MRRGEPAFAGRLRVPPPWRIGGGLGGYACGMICRGGRQRLGLALSGTNLFAAQPASRERRAGLTDWCRVPLPARCRCCFAARSGALARLKVEIRGLLRRASALHRLGRQGERIGHGAAVELNAIDVRRAPRTDRRCPVLTAQEIKPGQKVVPVCLPAWGERLQPAEPGQGSAYPSRIVPRIRDQASHVACPGDGRRAVRCCLRACRELIGSHISAEPVQGGRLDQVELGEAGPCARG